MFSIMKLEIKEIDGVPVTGSPCVRESIWRHMPQNNHYDDMVLVKMWVQTLTKWVQLVDWLIFFSSSGKIIPAFYTHDYRHLILFRSFPWLFNATSAWSTKKLCKGLFGRKIQTVTKTTWWPDWWYNWKSLLLVYGIIHGKVFPLTCAVEPLYFL